MLSLEAREQLNSLYQRLKFGSAEWQDCVSWAIERLQQDDEGDDLDIVLLAAATSSDEVPALFQQIADRHLAPEALNDDLAAGKHLVRLHQAYRDGQETVATLEPQLWRMYRKLRYPDWLTMLAFHCELATDVPAYRVPFDAEFDYLAGLWNAAESLAAFSNLYDPEVSKSRDVAMSRDA